MLFIGLIMAGAAVVVGAAIVIDNADPTELGLLGTTVPGITSEWQVFLAGAAVAVVFMAGLTFASFGMGRSLRKRREYRSLRDDHEEFIHTLEMEKAQLQRELARRRAEQASAGRSPRPDGVGQRSAMSRNPA